MQRAGCSPQQVLSGGRQVRDEPATAPAGGSSRSLATAAAQRAVVEWGEDQTGRVRGMGLGYG